MDRYCICIPIREIQEFVLLCIFTISWNYQFIFFNPFILVILIDVWRWLILILICIL